MGDGPRRATFRFHGETADLADVAAAESRVLLTRDVALLKHGRVTWGRWLRSVDPDEQVREIVRRFDLRRRARPFTRCSLCNGEVAPVEAAEVIDRVPPRAREIATAYSRCTSCDNVYWDGTHLPELKARVAAWLGEDA